MIYLISGRSLDMPIGSPRNQPQPSMQGSKHRKAIYTEDQVRQMRHLHEKLGLCVKCVAKLYEANYQTVWSILTYDTWRHVR